MRRMTDDQLVRLKTEIKEKLRNIKCHLSIVAKYDLTYSEALEFLINYYHRKERLAEISESFDEIQKSLVKERNIQMETMREK